MTFSIDPIEGLNNQLSQLVERGFQFVHPTGGAGEIVAIVGVRAHRSVTDVICLRAEGDARAARMPADEEDVLAPTRTMWERRGPAVAVLADLLALPDDYAIGSVVGSAAGAREVAFTGVGSGIDSH